MKKLIFSAVSAVVALVVAACSCLSTAKTAIAAAVTPHDAGYVVGRATVLGYNASDGKFDEQYRAAAVKVWTAFDANYDQFADIPTADIPAKLKELAGGSEQVGKVVDKLWSALSAKVDPARLKDALAGLREGIKAGIVASNG